MSEKFLVTGASGCIGSWVLRVLHDRSIDFVASDLIKNTYRTQLLMSEEELTNVEWIDLDVTDTDAVNSVMLDKKITRVVHLAGLQIPFAKANPPLGAAVNVQGTVNIFEAVRGANVAGLAYASSVAVFGPESKYPPGRLMDDAPKSPDTLYGIYKDAGEEVARVYWQDWQVPSIGLRPAVVYGVGRDQGLTSDISKAIMAAASSQPFEIRFDGLITLQHAKDVASMFIDAALGSQKSAMVCNLRNDVVEVSDFVAILKKLVPDANIDFINDAPLPFPANYDDSNLRSIMKNSHYTPLEQAIEMDIQHYQELIAEGKLDIKLL